MCPLCNSSIYWQSSVEQEDLEGNEYFEHYYECGNCKAFITVSENITGGDNYEFNH